MARPAAHPAIPQPLLELLTDENARSVLLKVVYGNEHGRTLRYSETRDDLRMHPETFQRSLSELEDYALIRSRAPGPGRQIVLLEPTVLGSFLADYWDEMNNQFAKLAKKQKVEDSISAMCSTATGR